MTWWMVLLLIVLIFKTSEKEARYSWRFAFSMIALASLFELPLSINLYMTMDAIAPTTNPIRR